MNIVIFACVDFPEGPATTSRIRLLSRTLHAAGHSVALAIFNANAKNAITENTMAEGCFESIDFRYLSGRTVRPTGFFGILSDTVKGIANSVFYLAEMRKEGRADAVLLYTPDIFRCLPVVLMAKLGRIPLVMELCEIFSSDRRKGGLKETIGRLGAQFGDRKLPVWSSGVMAISTKIIGYLKQQGISDGKIVHLPVLVDYDRFVRESRAVVPCLTGKRYFLNSGALDEKEGLNFIMEAFAHVAAKYEEVRLALTGSPAKGRREQVLEFARKLNIEDKLIFTGYLSPEQLIWAYQHAAALLCCRAGMEFANYGFPTKLAEYLSSGSPVIANGVGDMPIYLKDGESAFMAVAEDSASISGQMKKVLDNTALAVRIGLNGRKVAERYFDFRNYEAILDEFLRSVCLKQESGEYRGNRPNTEVQSK
ncbi:MAG TPA: glycosyltransferase [Geobacteraceae bacterium]|nr:glycosyltransferase [Geobacteraceae bacterium]